MADNNYKIIITAIATQALAVLRQVRDAAGRIVGSKSSINIDTAPLDEVREKAAAAGRAMDDAAKSASSWRDAYKSSLAGLKNVPAPDEKAKKSWRDFFTEVGQGGKRAGKILNMAMGAGAIGSIINSAKQIAGHFIQDAAAERIFPAEMAADAARQSAAQAESNEKRRVAETGMLASLSQISSLETLSNAQRERAVELVNKLNGAYGGLGLSVDQATGKVAGLAEAQVQMAEKQRQQQLADIRRQRGNLALERSTRQDVADDLGDGSFGGTLKGIRTALIGRQRDSEAAVQRLGEIAELDRELAMKQKELEKVDLGKNRQLAADATLGVAERELAWQKALNDGKEEQVKKERFIAEERRKGSVLTDVELGKLYNLTSQLEAQQKITEKQKVAKNHYDELIANEKHLLELQRLKQQALDDEALRLEVVNELRRQNITDEAKINELYNLRKTRSEESKAGIPALSGNDFKPDRLAAVGLYNSSDSAIAGLQAEGNRSLQVIAGLLREQNQKLAAGGTKAASGQTLG